jgi:hypothetical protein
MLDRSCSRRHIFGINLWRKCIGMDNKRVRVRPILVNPGPPTRDSKPTSPIRSPPLCNPRARPSSEIAIHCPYLFVSPAPHRKKLFGGGVECHWRTRHSPAQPPTHSEQAAGHGAHDLFGLFPSKKSWIIIGRFFEDGMPPLIVASPMDLKQSIDFFVKGILDSSLEDESDASWGLMVAATTLIHEHTETQRPVHRASTRPRKANTLRGLLPWTTSTQPSQSSQKPCFGGGIGCQETCS